MEPKSWLVDLHPVLQAGELVLAQALVQKVAFSWNRPMAVGRIVALGRSVPQRPKEESQSVLLASFAD
jgi:hypothetical protein